MISYGIFCHPRVISGVFGPNFDQIGTKYNKKPTTIANPQPPVGAPGPGPGSGASGFVLFIGFVLYLVPFWTEI